MKRKYTQIFGLLMVFALTVSIASCTPKETPTEPGAAEPTKATGAEPTKEEAAPPEEGEVAKIGVYTVAWSPSSMAMMAELIDMFNEEYKGKIEAEYIQGDWGEGDTYVSAGVAGGGGIGDVVEWWVGGAEEWYNQNFLADLSPYVDDDVRNTITPDLWESRTTEDGAIFFSCSVRGGPSLIFYNPAHLEAAGIEPPGADGAWTWDEFMANAKLLTLDASGKHLGEEGFDPDNVVQWGFLPRLDDEKVWEEAHIFAMQASGKPMIRIGDDGEWDIFFDEDAMPALRAFFNVINDGVAPDLSIGLSGDSQDEAFVQGTASMVLRGYFNIGVLHDRYPDFNFSVMPAPMEPGSKYFTDNLGQGFAVPITSENPEAAAEFVFWFQETKPQALWASALYLAPCNPNAYQDPVLLDDPDWDAMRFYNSIMEVVAVDHNVNEREFLTTLYAPNMISVVMGEKTLDEAIAEIKAGSKDILNQD